MENKLMLKHVLRLVTLLPLVLAVTVLFPIGALAHPVDSNTDVEGIYTAFDIDGSIILRVEALPNDERLALTLEHKGRTITGECYLLGSREDFSRNCNAIEGFALEFYTDDMSVWLSMVNESVELYYTQPLE